MKDRIGYTKAYSYTVTDMEKGWKVVPQFSSVSIFIIGKKILRITVHVDVNSPGFGVLGGAASKFAEVTSGSIYGNTVSNIVQMPDITTEAGTKMRDVASAGVATVWASIDIL